MNVEKFIAEIEANIADFKRDMLEAKKLASTMPEHIVTEVTASIQDFKRNLLTAEAMAREFDGTHVDAEFSGDLSALKNDVAEAQSLIKALDKEKASPKVEADIKRATTNITTLQTMLDRLEAEDYDVDVEADTKKAMQRIRLLEMNLKSLEKKKVNTHVDANVAKALAKIALVKTQLKELTGKSYDVKGTFKLDIKKAWEQIQEANNNFQNKMDEMANAIRSFGTVFRNQIQGVAIASFSALIPVIASVVPAVMAVGNAIGVLGGGALGLAGAFSVAGGAAVAFGGMAVSALAMLKNGTIQASDATRAYQTSLEGLKSAWQSIVSSNATSIFSAMASGLRGITSAAQQLTPFLSGIAKAVAVNAQAFENWITKSDTAKAAFNALNTTGVSIFNNLLGAVGRFGSGFVSLFTQFMPLFSWVSEGFKKMGTDFEAWSNKLSTSRGIQSFINYVKTNLPVIGQIFGDTFMGIFNLFKAFAPNTQSILQGLSELTSKFRSWSETVAQSDGFKKFIDYVQTNGPVVMDLIGSLIMVLVNFATAMAPIGAAVLKVVTAFAQWLAKLFETNPVIAQIVGILAMLGGAILAILPTVLQLTGFITDLILPFMNWIKTSSLVTTALEMLGAAFGAINAPILIIIGVIAALVAAFVVLWNTNEQFREGVITAWNAIMDTIMTVVNAISSFVMSIWGQIVSWWTENQELIRASTEIVWNAIMTIIQTVMSVLGPIIQAGWTVITTIIQTAWELIKIVIQTALTVILGIIKAIMQVITGDWQGAWETIKSIGQAIWEAIKAAISVVWNAIVTIITTVMNTIKTVISAAWNVIKTVVSTVLNAIKTIVTTVWNAIKTVISTVLSAIKAAVTAAWNAIKSAITSAMNAIKSLVTSAWNAIKSAVSSALNAIKSVVTSSWNAIKSSISSAMNGIRSAVQSGFNAVVSAVQSGLQRAVSAVRSFVGQMISAGANLARGIANGIMSMAGHVMSVARNLASRAVSAIKSVLHIASPSRVMIGIGKYTSEGLAIGIARKADSVVSEMVQLSKDVSSAYAPDLATVDHDFSRNLDSANSDLSASIKNDVEVGLENKEPAHITLSLGGRQFRAFCEDVKAESNVYTDLEQAYL